MKTVFLRREDVNRRWIELDASGQVLGRLAVKAATLLMGKERPTFTPGVDTGDFVIVTNAKTVKVTGNKEAGKVYFQHTQHVGSWVNEPVKSMRQRKPENIIILAVKRMLPKNTMGEHMLKRLKVYGGGTHPHEAQKPEKQAVPQKRSGKAKK